MAPNARFQLVPLLAFLLVMTALSPGWARAEVQADVQAELERAHKLLSTHDYRGACKAYERASELSQGKSALILIGLSDCYRLIMDEEKALAAARQALAVAATPAERAEATKILGYTLLRQSAEASWTEAASLFKELVASSGGGEGRGGLLSALLALHRDQDAAEILQSLRKQGMTEEDIQQKVLFGVANSVPKEDTRRLDDVNERLFRLDPDTPLRLGGKVSRPEIRHQVKPEFTDDARRHSGFSGTVILETIIDRQGNVRDLRVLKEQPYGLTEAAVKAVKSWTFQPAALDGKPVTVWYVLTVNFQMR
jgi:TonB family protein